MAETVQIVGDGITLDLLLWRRFGIAGQVLVPATLALNPGLAAVGVLLTPGLTVTLPSAPAPTLIAAVPVDLFA